MDVTLGLLSDSPVGDDGGGVPSSGSTTGSEVTSSSISYPVGDRNLDDLELGLGLSIGVGVGVGVGGWSQYARILTAKDLASNNNNNNSSSSSCSVNITRNSSTSGIKRAATDSLSPPNPNSVVGWPPVSKAHRMPSFANEVKSPTEQNKSKSRTVGIKDCSSERNRIPDKKYRSIKVNMDGSFIGRKVDLNAHTSYEMLAQTLDEMFFQRRPNTEATRSSRLLDATSEFVLTYEDKDGDCMLVGDVPWEMFVSSVNRLRIMKNSESNELAPRFQENNERQRTDAV